MADTNYDALAARLTDPATELPAPARVVTGAAAAAEGRAFLLGEYGSEEALERAMKPGRPKVGENRGPSPSVRGRLSEVDYARLVLLIEKTGKSQSELVREAVHLLLEKHPA